MAGGGNKEASSSSSRKSHQRDSQKGTTNNNNNPQKPSPSKSKPKPSPIQNPENFQPPPPAYGFHMLDRRTILLADGTARSYLALPPDYRPDTWPGLGFDRQFPPDGSRKRKFEMDRQRQHLLQYGNMASDLAPSTSRDDIMRGPNFKTAFFNFLRLVNENANQKKKYLADGKQGPLHCLVCARSSKDFPDMHSLIMHTYNPEKATPDQVPDHLGLHKALCILMGWNYLMPPDNSRAYQRLSAEEAAADRDDLIMWPPHVIIHNTATGKGRDGRMEGLGNKAMDMKLIGLGFSSGKSKAMYGREGHLGITAVKFAGDEGGLRDAMKLADFFEKQKHGRGSWASVQSMFRPGKDDEKDPNFVKLDKKSGEKERILYGYLGTVFDLDTVDFDTRKKVTIESRRERGQP